MATQYKLVNPNIKGDFKTLFSNKTHFDAAQKCWEKLSSHFTNNVPLFAFSMERIKDKKLFHFLVKENINNNMVDYKISELKPTLSKDEEKEFRSQIANAENQSMKGGKKRRKYDDDSDFDDSEFDDSSDIYNKMKYKNIVNKSQPIVWWWYSPLPYHLKTFYIPTFAVPLTPYVEIQSANIIYPYYS